MYMRKKLSILFIGMLSAVVLSGCSSRFGFDGKLYTEENMNYFGSDKTVIEPITSLEIDSGYANFEIIASDNFYIEYSYYYITSEPKLTIEDGVLTFDDSEMNSGNYSVNLRKENYLKIYIPTQTRFDSVTIDKSSGDMNLGSFYAETCNIENSYGDTVISNCTMDDLKMKSSSGSILFEKSMIKEASVEQSYGELTMKDISDLQPSSQENSISNGKLSIDMSSGDLNMSGIQISCLDFVNSYGNVEIKDSKIGIISGNLSSGNLNLKTTDADNIEIENSYGEVLLAMMDKEENYRMNIVNSFGMITIGSVTLDDKEYNSNAGVKLIKVQASSGDVKLTFDNK